MDIQAALAQLVEGQNLTQAQTRDVFQEVMSGEATPAQIGGLLMAMRVKGETAEEIAGAAQTMRALSTKVEIDVPYLVDTCGTGGSGGAKLFNISTAAAFVTAAAGAKVAKHGNRKMTSQSGSADVLEVAGVNIALEPAQIARCISEVGVGFLFAQAHHSAMRYAAPIRQELKVRTMMNLLGPLTNPANAKRQVIGVFSAQWQQALAEVLKLLGSEH
ncbi:MAG: anthranilate phosphoribosyltransferase, partial [Pseudomonadales bacterium]